MPVLNPENPAHDESRNAVDTVDEPASQTGHVDTGSVGSGPDNADNDPVIDADVFSNPDGDSPIIMVGLLPESSTGNNLVDADILSDSTGARDYIAADIGPDIFDEPVIFVEALNRDDRLADVWVQGDHVDADQSAAGNPAHSQSGESVDTVDEPASQTAHVDTGSVGSGPDNADNHPVIDADVFSNPDGDSPIIMVGLLPESSTGNNLVDADILSDSTGARDYIAADIGPDLFDEPVIFVEALNREGAIADAWIQGDKVEADESQLLGDVPALPAVPDLGLLVP